MSRAPSFIREAAPSAPRIGKWIALALLALALLAQLFFSQRAPARGGCALAPHGGRSLRRARLQRTGMARTRRLQHAFARRDRSARRPGVLRVQ